MLELFARPADIQNRWTSSSIWPESRPASRKLRAALPLRRRCREARSRLWSTQSFHRDPRLPALPRRCAGRLPDPSPRRSASARIRWARATIFIPASTSPPMRERRLPPRLRAAWSRPARTRATAISSSSTTATACRRATRTARKSSRASAKPSHPDNRSAPSARRDARPAPISTSKFASTISLSIRRSSCQCSANGNCSIEMVAGWDVPARKSPAFLRKQDVFSKLRFRKKAAK